MKELVAGLVVSVFIAILTYINYISLDVGAFLIFVSIIASLIFMDRKKIKREGIIIIRRTLKGREFIDTIAKRHKKFWNVVGYVGIVVGVIAMIAGTVLLSTQTIKILEGSKDAGVKLILPGPVSNPTDAPGVFFFPWWIWFIGISVVIIPHEFMHGIMCRIENIKIKSVGWILLVLIPGAFVEPDENQLKKAKRSTKLKIYAAGSFANIAIAFFIMIMFSIVFTAWFAPSGLAVAAVNNSPAYNAKISGAIHSIDNHIILNKDDLVSTLSLYNPGDSVTIVTYDASKITPAFSFDLSPKPAVISEGEGISHTIVLGEHNETKKAYLGVVPIMTAYSASIPTEPYAAISFLFLWIFVFSLGIGIVNLLPLKPFDGGLMFEELVGHFTKKTKIIVGLVSSAIILILVFNIVGPILL